MKLVNISKFTLAMVKALQEIPTEDISTEFEFIDRLGLTEGFSKIISLAEYAIYFSHLTRYVHEDFILRALVPEVAKEAGFLNLVEKSTPVMKEHDYEHLVYVEDTPPLVIEEYHKDPTRWIQAFAKVARRAGTLPSFAEMSTQPFGQEYFRTFNQYAFCALLNADPSEEDWKRFLRAVDEPEGEGPVFLEEIILEKQARYQKLPLVAVDFGMKVVDELPMIEIHSLPAFSGELIAGSEAKISLEKIETKVFPRKFTNPADPCLSSHPN